MRNIETKRFTALNVFCALMIMILAVLAVGCGDSYGKKLMYNKCEVYYTSAVNETEAKKLGEYLMKAGFADGSTKTVQLNKNGNTYEFRMVVKKGMEQDMQFVKIAKQFATELSRDVFNRNNVDIHLCDENLKTLKVVVPL